MLIPTVIEENSDSKRAYDIFSMMLSKRIIFVNGEVTSSMAASVTAQLLFLEAEDADADIIMYINSPGGSVTAGLAIYDTMQYVKPDVSTVCLGIAASMGSFLLAGGTNGKRFALPNSEVMIHQPLGGTQGQCSDIQIHARYIQQTRDRLNKILAENMNKEIDYIEKITDRDNYLTSSEALEIGIVDKIITKRNENEVEDDE